MARTIQGVIFDLDGVIADSHPLHEIAWQSLLYELGIDPTGVRLPSIIRQGRTRKEILQLLAPGISDHDAGVLGNRKNELYLQNVHRLRPVPGVLDWIAQLNDRCLPMAVATSASRERALATLAQFGARHFFRAILTSSEIPAGKPDPALFVAAAEALALRPSEALVVEDSPAGLVAAEAAGMRSLLFCPEPCDFELRSLAPDFFISEFNEVNLAALMSELNPGTVLESRL